MNDGAHDQALIAAWSDKLSEVDSTDESYAWLHDLHLRHCQWREQSCINLLASEAPMSAEARALLGSPLASRTAAGHIGQRVFAGAKYIDEIEALCQATLQKLFDCRYAEHRVLGGTQACQIIYAWQLNRGDTLISVSEENGGDSSNSSPSILTSLGVKVLSLPFNEDGISIDFDALESLLTSNTVKMLSLGLSVSLLSPDHLRLFELCRQHNVFCHIDCAHELGLIAGGAYPNPLSLGADVITASTGKTFSGPQGGVILWNNHHYSQGILDYTFPYSVGGYQNNRILALTLSALELLSFGRAYMKNVCVNTQALAERLDTLHLPPFASKRGYSQTHQLLLCSKKNKVNTIKRLQDCNIITSAAIRPDSKGSQQRKSIRLGVMEVTRLGMQAEEMHSIADFITRALLSDEAADNIATEINRFRHDFQHIHYCHQYPGHS